MNPWLLLIPGFAVFCLGSFYSYSRAMREHWSYLPVFVALMVIGGFIWVAASKKLGAGEDHVKQIMLFSLAWDVIMIVAYYALPLIFKGEGFNWQAYAAAVVTVAGIFWFKLATG
jgi:hypothetical protein